MIPHHIYFEVLANMHEDMPDWELVLSGYLTMQFVDDWSILGAARIAGDPRFTQLPERLKGIPHQYAAEAQTLQRIVDVMAVVREDAILTSIAPLNAYAMLLERRQAWPLAADAYLTLAQALQWVRPLTDQSVQTAREAYQNQERCLRQAAALH